MTAHAKVEARDETLPEWRLDDLFSGRDDPRIEAELAEAAKANTALAALKGAFVAARGEPERLGALIAEGVDLYERATTRLWAVGAYASLAASVARDDPLWSKFESDLRARSADIAAESLFFTLELNALDEAEIEAALAVDSAAARYRPWLRRVRLGRPHELDGELERMLLDRAPALANWTRLYDEALGRLRVRAGREALTLAQALNRLSDPDERRRRQVANGLARALEGQAPVL
ncbi:MAG TPA: oligoendopeptidase F, partial [Caulobacteraceae bacterium]|nr:oligoendopeptidase F [Caulobacteraceae bacterium]